METSEAQVIRYGSMWKKPFWFGVGVLILAGFAALVAAEPFKLVFKRKGSLKTRAMWSIQALGFQLGKVAGTWR